MRRPTSLLRSQAKASVRIAERRKAIDRKWFLYKVYFLLDPQTGKILYIGKSKNPIRRKRSFEVRYKMKTRLGVCQRFRRSVEVKNAESKLIRKHKPPYNIRDNRNNKGKTRSYLSQ